MPETPDFRDQYENITDLKVVAQKIKDLESVYDHHKALSGQAWHEMEYLKKIHAPELMGDKTIIKWKDFPYRMQKRGDVYAGCLPGMAEEVKEWLFEHEGEALVKETVNASSLKAWLKRRLGEGKPIPLDLFKIEPYEVVTVVKV